jgi:hypothetical protein
MTAQGHGVSPIVDLGEIGIVHPAHERQVQHGVVTAIAERVAVVELEPLASGAPPALLVHVSASTLVALVHGALDRRRDLARPRRGVGLGEGLPGSAGSAKPPGFEPLQLLGDRVLDDQGQIAVGHRGAHQGSETLELVAKGGGRGELDPVSSRGEGRHDGGLRLTRVRTERGPR